MINTTITIGKCKEAAESTLTRVNEAISFFESHGFNRKADIFRAYIQLDRGDFCCIAKKGYFLDRFGSFTGDRSCKHHLVGLSGCHFTGRTYTMPSVIIYK